MVRYDEFPKAMNEEVEEGWDTSHDNGIYL